MNPRLLPLLLVLLHLGAGGAPSRAWAARPAADVDAARLEGANPDPANWLTYGRTYSEQRFSPLTRITAVNARNLGLAWYADFDTDRGQEATPLIIDGVMYVTTAWSIVRAFDAKTGRPLWSYDPKVPRTLGVRGCCDVVNRGVGAWGGKLYLGTFDGRLVALDAVTGKPVWSVMTVDPAKSYTITMAPRLIKGRVIIGNGGSEFGVRGYLSAYDALTGKLIWRFYTVPGDPAQPFESDTMAKAAKTWFGDWWTLGGGGTVWEGISYDPSLNLIYFGTGNGAEWNQGYRSAGRGDNLFLSSIVAINADTGAYVWHYQATPGEEWDFDAVQQLVLADLSIDGKPRAVLMQANKNGFFYVLDRKTGELISATAFTPVNWASGVDLKSGRPRENPGIRYDDTGKAVSLLPGALGAHSWQSMAFNPGTGLVYIPAQEIGMAYTPVKNFKAGPLGWNLGVGTRNLPNVKGYLVAWDPVKQKEIWRANYLGPWNGGVLTTAGNLVVQGNAAGDFAAYRADTGEKLWSTSAQTPVMAAPVSYEVDGEQYVAVLAGWGGAYPLLEGQQSAQSGNERNISRVLVYKLGGTAHLPAVAPDPDNDALPLITQTADAATIAAGEGLFDQYCSVCHGQAAVGGGVIPDLRKSPYLPVEAWYGIVIGGALHVNGMAPFAAVLDRSKATAIRAYVIERANESAQPGSTATADNVGNASNAGGVRNAGSTRNVGSAGAAAGIGVAGATGAPGGPSVAHLPDLKRGAVIAAQGATKGAPACASCHAFNGASDGSGAFPRIAGQSAYYLVAQLHAFRSGVRQNAIMAAIAKNLSVDDVVDVSAYFAAMQTPFPALPIAADATLLRDGEQLAASGIEAKGIPACATCHGDNGAGESPTIPYLGGQYAHYIAFELEMWQRGFRHDSPDAMMLFAKQLSDRDVAAVAAYYQSLEPGAAAGGSP
jgi:alcohol dehydrogenase (cytochrome c)/quinohemoprotein ethanol dehydrogenase